MVDVLLISDNSGDELILDSDSLPRAEGSRVPDSDWLPRRAGVKIGIACFKMGTRLNVLKKAVHVLR